MKALHLEHFDGVVLDLMLPGADGASIIKTVRNDKRFSNLPILVLTAKSEEDNVLYILESGADNYITKPFDGKILAARVKALLRRKADLNVIKFFELVDSEVIKHGADKK